MIDISLEGVKDAVDSVKEIVIPWRRNNAKKKAKLDNSLQQAEIQRINAETLITKAKAERENAGTDIDRGQASLILSQVRKTEAEAALILAQREKVIAEADKERAELRQSQIELVFSIIDRYAPNLNGNQKVDYVTKLLPVLDTLLSSEVKIR
jgi:hypothetical protein